MDGEEKTNHNFEVQTLKIASIRKLNWTQQNIVVVGIKIGLLADFLKISSNLQYYLSVSWGKMSRKKIYFCLRPEIQLK